MECAMYCRNFKKEKSLSAAMVKERFRSSELMNRISLYGNWNSKHSMQRFWLPEEQIKEFQKATPPIKAMKILAKIVKKFFSRTLEISPRLVTIQGVLIPKKNLQKKQGALWCFKLSYSHPPLPSYTNNLENQQLWTTITTKASNLAITGGGRMNLKLYPIIWSIWQFPENCHFKGSSLFDRTRSSFSENSFLPLGYWSKTISSICLILQQYN